MSATPLPVSIALAGQTNARRARNVSATSRTAHVRIAARICGTLTWKPSPTWPRTWIVMMTAATCSRGSRVLGRITGYVLVPSTSVRLLTSSPRGALIGRRDPTASQHGRSTTRPSRPRRTRAPHGRSGVHGITALARARCGRTCRRRPSSTGRSRRRATARGPRPRSASPRPRWIQPSWPLAWPPPTVTSWTVVRSPTRVSSHAPMASTLGAGWRRRTAAHEPIGAGRSPSPRADVAPELGRRGAVDDDEVEQPVEVEVDDGRAARPLVAHDPRRLGALHERAVGLPDQQVVRIAGGVPLLGLDVALGDEQVGHAVVVDVGELVVPRRRRQDVAAGERAVGRDAARRARCPRRSVRSPSPASVCSLLSPWLVRNTSGQPVAGDVLAGDAHAPQLQRAPPVGFGVRARRLAGHDAPQLVAAVAVVLPVVRHAQVASAGPAPVAEQHRQRAVAGRQGDRRRRTRRRPRPAARAGRPRTTGDPVRGSRRRRGSAARSMPSHVALKATVHVSASSMPSASSARSNRQSPRPRRISSCADAQHDEVDVAVAVDVERVGAGDRGQIGDRRRHGGEARAPRRSGCRCGRARPARCRRRSTARCGRRRRSRTRRRRRRRSTGSRRRSGGRSRRRRRRSAARRRPPAGRRPPPQPAAAPIDQRRRRRTAPRAPARAD